jgi:predicted phage terminase large subunit-like protein
MLTDAEIIELEHLYELRDIDDARDSLLKLTEYLMPLFVAKGFHKVYYMVLDMFAKGIIKNLIITMPPQHGKSTGSTMYLPAFLFGLNPDLKIAISSYSTPITQRFNRQIQRIIDTPEYRNVFPECNLGESNTVTVMGNPLRNASEFEIVDSKGKIRGKLMSVGRGGALTSQSVDIWIGDDLYKDYSEGNSPVVRDAVWDWYITVPLSRQPKQKLKVFTRWHEDDSIGRIEKHETVVTVNSLQDITDAINEHGDDVWIKLNFEAIQEQPKTEFDDREKGLSLWEAERPLKNLEKIRKLSVEKFNCLYQGNPMSSEGLLYQEFQTYNVLPISYDKKNYTDTADTGTDYLFSACYIVNDGNYYITDVVYTDEPMEVTEVSVPKMLLDNETKKADIESNNGGRGFARTIQKEVRGQCAVDWFHQSSNKESRIITHSNLVTQHIFFPEGWESRWPTLYEHLRGFKRLFRANKQDGGPDVLTGIIEKNFKVKRRGFIGGS